MLYSNKKIACVLALVFVANYAFAQSASQAYQFLKLEQFQNAGRQFRELAAKTPSATNDFHLGNYYITIGQPDSAKMYYQKAANDPKSVYAQIGLGTYSLFARNKPEASAKFAQALAMSKSKNADVFYFIGRAYADTLHLDADPISAIQYLETAVRLSPKNTDYLIALGDAYLLKNDGSAAALNYDKAIMANPNLADGYFRRGKLYVRARNYDAGLAEYKLGLSKDTNYAPGYKQIGELYNMAKKYKLAIYNYEKYLSKIDNNPTAQFKYGVFLYYNGNHQQAVDIFEKVLPVLPDNVYIHRLLAYTQYELGKYLESGKNMETFLARISPDLIIAKDYLYQGRLALKNNNQAQGFAGLAKAVEKDTSLRKNYAELAVEYFKEKNYELSALLYEQAIAKGNTDKSNYFNMGRSWYFAKQYEKSRDAQAKMIELSPKSPTVFLWKAYAEMKLDPEQTKGSAKESFERFAELAQDTSLYKAEQIQSFRKDVITAYTYLGDYELKVKFNKAGADRYYKKVLELDPTNTTAKQRLALTQKDVNDFKKMKQKPAPAPSKK